MKPKIPRRPTASPEAVPGALILLLGRQGTGKTTLGHRLEHALGGKFYSGGALIRAEIDRETALGRQMKGPIEAGDSVPADCAFGLLEVALRSASGDPLILDGFPYRAQEIERLQRVCGKRPDHVLVLEHPAVEVLVQRIRNRQECTSCYATYGPGASPKEAGQCDWCGRRLRARLEDEDAMKIVKRHASWEQRSPEILRFYESEGLLKRIDANQSPDAVLHQAITAVRPWEAKIRR